MKLKDPRSVFAFILAAMSILILIAGFSFFGILKLAQAPNGIQVERIEIKSIPEDAARIEDGTLVISQKAERIYAEIYSSGLWGVTWQGRTIARWHLSDDRIVGELFSLTAGEPRTVWLDPIRGQTFRPGDYQFELKIAMMKAGRISFKIE
jgi:hypothetical protein